MCRCLWVFMVVDVVVVVVVDKKGRGNVTYDA